MHATTTAGAEHMQKFFDFCKTYDNLATEIEQRFGDRALSPEAVAAFQQVGEAIIDAMTDKEMADVCRGMRYFEALDFRAMIVLAARRKAVDVLRRLVDEQSVSSNDA